MYCADRIFEAFALPRILGLIVLTDSLGGWHRLWEQWQRWNPERQLCGDRDGNQRKPDTQCNCFC
jgi:hypothetical protein